MLVPLSVVVTDAVKRWYVETNKEAVKGDVVRSLCLREQHSTYTSKTLKAVAQVQKQQALLGQMLLEGYGCDVNQSAARMWVDKARRRGYRMAGVYCEL